MNGTRLNIPGTEIVALVESAIRNLTLSKWTLWEDV